MIGSWRMHRARTSWATTFRIMLTLIQECRGWQVSWTHQQQNWLSQKGWKREATNLVICSSAVPLLKRKARENSRKKKGKCRSDHQDKISFHRFNKGWEQREYHLDLRTTQIIMANLIENSPKVMN